MTDPQPGDYCCVSTAGPAGTLIALGEKPEVDP